MIIFSALIYLSFIAFIIFNSQKYKKQSNSIHVKDLVSVVIAVKNEENNLKNLINALSNQSFPENQFEVIFVNNSSSDKSLEVLESNSHKIKNIKIIDTKKAPKNYDNKIWALEQGINQSKGEIILHTDGDCIPDKDWIFHLVNQFKNVDVGFVCGVTPLVGHGFISNLLILESIAQDSISAIGLDNNLFFSCNGRSLGYRKQYYNNCNGYQDIQYVIGGDDDLLMHKIHSFSKCIVKYVYSNDSFVYSSTPRNISDFMNQRLRYANKGSSIFKFSFVSIELKLLVLFLYLLNGLVCYSIIQFIYTENLYFLIGFIIKIIADYAIVLSYAKKISFKVKFTNFLILSIIHPFYIIVFSTFSTFKTVKWK